MANRIFIIPRRNDLEGMNVQVTDLWPNTSQKNSVLDGEGQTHYVGACPDAPGATITYGTAYVRGSKSTTLTANPSAMGTTGGANDCTALDATVLGLAAYLRERVAKDPGGANLLLPFANANTVAGELRTRAEAGGDLDATYINARLVAAAGGATALDGGGSFGSVLDILRILSGETYISPQYTIISDGVNFLGLAGRDILVTAQLAGKTFLSEGHFLTPLEAGYVGRPTMINTGFAKASVAAGQLHYFAQDTMAVTNPAFTYGASGTAQDIAGNAIPATGVQAFLRVYSQTGALVL